MAPLSLFELGLLLLQLLLLRFAAFAAAAGAAAAGAAGFSFRYRPSWASPYGRKVRLYPNPEASTWAECALFHGIA